MKRNVPGVLATITGSHRRPTTLEVLWTVNELDAAARRAEHQLDAYLDGRARSQQRVEDSSAIAAQIDWIWESREAACSEAERAKFSALAEDLLSLQLDILAEQRRDWPKPPPAPTLRQVLYIPVAYALSMLRNLILLALCWLILAAVVIALLRAI